MIRCWHDGTGRSVTIGCSRYKQDSGRSVMGRRRTQYRRIVGREAQNVASRNLEETVVRMESVVEAGSGVISCCSVRGCRTLSRVVADGVSAPSCLPRKISTNGVPCVVWHIDMALRNSLLGTFCGESLRCFIAICRLSFDRSHAPSYYKQMGSQ